MNTELRMKITHPLIRLNELHITPHRHERLNTTVRNRAVSIIRSQLKKSPCCEKKMCIDPHELRITFPLIEKVQHERVGVMSEAHKCRGNMYINDSITTIP